MSSRPNASVAASISARGGVRIRDIGHLHRCPSPFAPDLVRDALGSDVDERALTTSAAPARASSSAMARPMLRPLR